jgi:group I intron endonuclease
MIGIYKITSPSKKVYIGQSINIEKRFKGYYYSNAKGQTILNKSFLKYGIDNHIFEIVCECKKSELYKLEAYYQTLYSANSKNGLNCSVTSGLELDFSKYKTRKEKYIREEFVNSIYLKNKEKFNDTISIINNIIF